MSDGASRALFSHAHARALEDEGEQLHLPCKSWNALEACEVHLPGSKRETFAADALDLHVACGAAAEALQY